MQAIRYSRMTLFFTKTDTKRFRGKNFYINFIQDLDISRKTTCLLERKKNIVISYWRKCQIIFFICPTQVDKLIKPCKTSPEQGLNWKPVIESECYFMRQFLLASTG